MKTRAWKPSSEPTAAASVDESHVTLNELLWFAKESETPTEFSAFGALYAIIMHLRERVPFNVSRQNGQELFRFDGQTSTFDVPFAQALAGFEHFLLNEHKKGYKEALDWIDQVVVDAGPDSAPATATENPASDRSPSSEDRAIRRRR